LNQDAVGKISNILFGWGIVVIMIGASFIFYKKKWTANEQIVNSTLTNNVGD